VTKNLKDGTSNGSGLSEADCSFNNNDGEDLEDIDDCNEAERIWLPNYRLISSLQTQVNELMKET